MRGQGRRLPVLLAAAALMLCLWLTAAGEDAGNQVTADDWSWDPNTVNTFTGTLDLTAWSGMQVTLKAEAVFSPAREEAEGAAPLFVIVDGRRIVMLKQKDTAETTAGSAPVSFTCSCRMPAEGRYSTVLLRVTAVDGQGNELARAERELYSSPLRPGSAENRLQLPFDAETAALWVAAAAALVWTAGILRRCLTRKNKNHRDGSDPSCRSTTV